MGKRKNIIRTAAADAISAAVRAEFEEHREEVLARLTNAEKAILFKEVYNRSRDTTEDLFISNRGRYYELFAGIMLGEIATIADVWAFDVTDTKPHEEGGDIVSSTGTAYQIKSPNSSIKILSQLVTLRNGNPTKTTMKRVLEDYYRRGNQGNPYRYGIFFGVPYFDTMLDLGHKTFENYAIENGTGFTFDHLDPTMPPKGMMKALANQNVITRNQVLGYLKQGKKQIAAGGADFDLLKMLGKSKRRGDPLTIIKELIVEVEKGGWVLRFNPSPGIAKTLVNDYGAVVRTSIQRYENHNPFYSILTSLGTNRGTYLSGNAYTKGNKSIDYFYDMKYENFDY